MASGKGIAVIAGLGVLAAGLLLVGKSKAEPKPPPPNFPPPSPPPPGVTEEENVAGLLATYELIVNNPSSFTTEEIRLVINELFSRGFRQEAIHLQSIIHERETPTQPKSIDKDGIPIFDPEDFPTEEDLEQEIINSAVGA